MEKCHANKSIHCSVTQCANHCSTSDYCSLDRVQIGTHEMNPTETNRLSWAECSLNRT